MRRFLVALVLAGLAINPALHWCCLGLAADVSATAMPSCHAATEDATTRVDADAACRHDWAPALAAEASTRAGATTLGAVMPVSFVPTYARVVLVRGTGPSPDDSPPVTPVRSLRI